MSVMLAPRVKLLPEATKSLDVTFPSWMLRAGAAAEVKIGRDIIGPEGEHVAAVTLRNAAVKEPPPSLRIPTLLLSPI